MLTALYIHDEWGRDIRIFGSKKEADEWLGNYCLARNESPEEVDYFIKEIGGQDEPNP